VNSVLDDEQNLSAVFSKGKVGNALLVLEERKDRNRPQAPRVTHNLLYHNETHYARARTEDPD
jgi:hypothetical protein